MTLPLTDLNAPIFKMFAPTLIASRDSSGRRRIEGVGSSTIRDHHGDSFTLKAMQKMVHAAKGMTAFMNHGYEIPKDVFGKIEVAKLSKTDLIDKRTKEPIYDLRLGILVAESNPLAVENFDLIDKDQINLGISIGAMIPDGGASLDKSPGGRLLIDDVDPVEFSLVGIPANPRSFVDYAVKALVGVYPDSKHWDKAHDAFMTKHFGGVDLKKALDDAAEVVDDEPEGTETPAETETVDAGETTKSVDGPDDEPEEVEGEAAAVEETTDGAEQPDDAGSEPAGAVEASIDEAHLGLGDDLEVPDEHPDLEKAKGTHQHPHAHVHKGEHEHGYGDTKTVHAHEHAHSHSHDHGADHDHADTVDDWSHNHPHNGSYDNEDHAHEEGAVKAEPVPEVRKTKVTVWEDDDGKTIQVDTGRSKPKDSGDQSVQDSLSPDTTGGQSEPEAEKPEMTAELALVATLGGNVPGVIKALLGTITAQKAELAQRDADAVALMAVVTKTMEGTAEIIRRVGELPAGRKTVEFPEIKADFSDLGNIYDEEVRRLMRRR